ncbi:hypothetical protein [Streptomyces sp. AD55]|uniref:hypothetical protein n=1 Tax=Streptomyces sp. AD55 TaxID=3242895 RepID=UPI003528E9E8
MNTPRSRPHPREAEILTALHAGGSNKGIAKQLGVDHGAVGRIRRDHNIPTVYEGRRLNPRSLDELWRQHARPLHDQHMAWDGPRINGITPALRYRGSWYSALAVAYRIQHGRDPVGQVSVECDVNACVAPTCVEDAPGRQSLRLLLRKVAGMPELPTGPCLNGHDRAEFGRLGRDLRPYCEGCKRDRKRAQTT